MRVIVNPGGTNERFARAQLRQATISVWPDNVTIFDRIVAGEADVMITDAIETRLQQRLRPQLCAVHPETPFNVSEKAYLLPRDEAWKAEVDGWLRPIVEDGELGRLLDRWLDHPWPRAAADAIDLAPLCRVIGERLAVMPDVARYKWNAKLAIDDPARERQLLAIWRISAVEFGISPEWAEPFMRAQIEAAKVIQRELFAQWERAGQGALADAPDLATVIRPRLDALTPRLLRELAMAWPALSDPGQRERIRAATKTIAENAGVSPASAAVAAAPLNAGLDP